MFCNKFKTAMAELELRQADLSALTGIPKSAVSQYASGKVEPPKERREAIATAMGLDADYFEQESPVPIIQKRGDNIHRIGTKELAKLIGTGEKKAAEIAENRELPGLYACKGNGNKYIYIINEAVFCRV